MPPVLTDYEFALDENGFVLNSDFGGGGTLPFVDVTQVAGLDSAPLRTTTVEHEGMDGTYIDASFMTMRTIVITGILYASAFDTDTLLDQLKQAYTSSVIRPFYYQLPAKHLRFVWAQGGGVQFDVDTNRRLGETAVQLTLLCSDPYIYDFPANFSSSRASVIPDIGMSFNVGFNMGFGGGIILANQAITNLGTLTAYPVFTLTGPLTNPVIKDQLSNTVMKFNLTLAASDTMVVDCRYKTVVLNGSVSKRSAYLGLNWFSVPAGLTDTFYLSQDAGTGAMSTVLFNTYY